MVHKEYREHRSTIIKESSSSHNSHRPSRSHSHDRRRIPDDDIEEFFVRNGLPPQESLRHCIRHAQSRLPPQTDAEPMRTQGYCSLTLLAATQPQHSIVQFRPDAHRLDVSLAEEARAVYGPIAPLTRSLGYLFIPGARPQDDDDDDEDEHGGHGGGRRRLRDRIFRRHRHDDDHHEESHEQKQHSGHLGEKDGQVILHVYSMALLPGIPLSTHRLSRLPSGASGAHRAALIRSLAHHFSLAWRNGRYPDAPRRPQSMLATSLRGRLEAMERSLPPRFRDSASEVLARLPAIEALPWVLTHGDLVPVNVLVDPRGGHSGGGAPGAISGLIDWAESEYLPFGTGLYGLEEMLSHAASLPEEEGPNGRGRRWGYYQDVSALRELFWSELTGMVPELRERGVMETVRLAAQMGVLLWCGIAFDDGKLDRVVQEGGGKDAAEVAKLDLFLLSPNGCKDSVGSGVGRSSRSNIESGSADEDQEDRFARGRRDRGNGNTKKSFLFQKTDDEENVQELRPESPIRHRL